ncbi:MAG: pyridoxal phosphate-dependent aminotransferase [Pseudomonadota bacterium]
MSDKPQPRPSLHDIKPYAAGESTVAGRRKIIKLASNESPLGPSPRAVSAFQAAAHLLARYPDPDQRALRAALAQLHGLDPAGLIIGTGSEALLDVIIRCYAGPGDEVLFPAFSFPVYPIAARAAGATPIEAEAPGYGADVDRLLAQVSPATKLVVIANPNNPTGTWIDAGALRRLRAGLPAAVLLVIDSAYAEYMGDADYEAGHALVAAGNVIVTRTFSKAYGLASARVGWAHGTPEMIDVLRRVRGVFPVTGPSLAAAQAALEDQQHLRRVVAMNAQLLPWFGKALAARGIRVLDNVRGNFLLALFDAWPGGATAADAALRAQGIIVRPVGVPNALRISLGAREELEACLAALDAAPVARVASA